MVATWSKQVGNLQVRGRQDMESYSVTFVFDVEADSPEDAARTAEEMAREPDAYPPIVTVKGPDGAEVDVDLAEV